VNRLAARSLLVLVAIAAAQPIGIARAAETPVTIPIFEMPGAAAAVDPDRMSTIADATAGRMAFVPVGHFSFPRDVGYLRQAVIWVRVPANSAIVSGAFSVETSFDVESATLYSRNSAGGWDASAFGMQIPYADRPVARVVPTARIAASSGSPLFLRLAYARPSPKLAIVNAAAIDAEDAVESSQEGAQIFLMGVFVTLALTNVALFAFARSRVYALYTVAMLLAALNCATLGYPFAWKWLWPHLAPPHYLTLTLLGALALTAIVFFTSELLDVRAFWPKVDRFLRIFAVAAAINGVCATLWYAGAYVGAIELDALLRLAIFVPFLILIASGIRAWRDGNPNAPFVVSGYFCQAVGIALYLSNFWMMSGESHSGLFTGMGLASDGLLLFGALAARLDRIQREAAEQSRLAAEQRRLAFTDGLTGVANRRAYDEALAREWERASRDGSPLSLILIDVDFFKRYNDTYGHIAGDACLQSVANAVGQCVHRPSDVFARYGGEEFAALLPQTAEAAAVDIAEAMCAAVRNLQLPHAASSLGVVSISAGVAGTAAAAFAQPALPHAADAALYRAKESGRNRVACAEFVGGGPGVRAAPC
jgi:diguanylate cyclase (GGDEF)-like protein